MNKTILIPSVIVAGVITWVATQYTYDQLNTYTPPDVTLQSTMDDAIALQQKADINCTKGEKPDMKNLDGKIIYACNFSQNEPFTHVFPDDVSGLTLVCSQLDNVFLPPGVAVVDGGGNCGSKKQYKANPQDNNNDWEVDTNSNFIKPLN